MYGVYDLFEIYISGNINDLYPDYDDQYQRHLFFLLSGLVNDKFNGHKFLDWLEEQYLEEFSKCQQNKNGNKNEFVDWFDAVDFAYKRVIDNYNKQPLYEYTTLQESDGHYFRDIGKI